MPATHSQMSGTSSSGIQTPSFTASFGFVDSPPPTQTSKPGPNSGWTLPTNATSLTSGATSWLGWPVSAVLNLRGRLEYAGLPSTRRLISSSALVPSMISSAATPATGEPRNGRGESPHASSVVRPTASSRCHTAGTSSIRIQWNWMFSRSVTSAVSRANSCPMVPSARTAAGESSCPSVRTRIMKNSASSSSSSSIAVLPPSKPGARCV